MRKVKLHTYFFATFQLLIQLPFLGHVHVTLKSEGYSVGRSDGRSVTLWSLPLPRSVKRCQVSGLARLAERVIMQCHHSYPTHKRENAAFTSLVCTLHTWLLCADSVESDSEAGNVLMTSKRACIHGDPRDLLLGSLSSQFLRKITKK